VNKNASQERRRQSQALKYFEHFNRLHGSMLTAIALVLHDITYRYYEVFEYLPPNILLIFQYFWLNIYIDAFYSFSLLSFATVALRWLFRFSRPLIQDP